MDPRRFFEVALPQMVARSFIDFVQSQGSIAFEVRGGGQWTFTFGSEEPVKRGMKLDAELKLTFTRRAFDAFIEGTLDTVLAVQRREVMATGTAFELLEAF